MRFMVGDLAVQHCSIILFFGFPVLFAVQPLSFICVTLRYVRMRFCVCRIASSNGFIVHAPDCTGVSMEYWWKHNCKENTEVAAQKPVPLRHYPLPFPR